MHLLTFAPLLDETNQTAENHSNFILALLQWFSLPLHGCVCLTGDNCSTNKATANLLGKPLLGCHAHRFNLAVESYLKEHLSPEVKKCSNFMSRLGNINLAGKLRLSSELRPIPKSDTRWDSTADMFLRLKKIAPHVDQTDDRIINYLQTPAERAKIRAHTAALSDFKSISVALQHRERTIADANYLFQKLIAAFPTHDFSKYLGRDANIIHDQDFENAIIKIQSGKEDDLTIAEEDSVMSLLKEPVDIHIEPAGGDLPFAQCMLKRQKTETSNGSKYINTSFLLPTSVEVERLFSQAGRVFSRFRRSMSPATLEMLMFLSRNIHDWDVSMVAMVVNEYDLWLSNNRENAEAQENEQELDFNFFF
jgi:hAT family C-terminal dimerisation region